MSLRQFLSKLGIASKGDRPPQRPSGPIQEVAARKIPEAFQAFDTRCHRIADCITSTGGTASAVKTTGPASPSQIETVEKTIGIQIPQALRSVLSDYAASFGFDWRLPDNFAYGTENSNPQWGACRWALSDLPALQQDMHQWIKDCFSNPEDSYDAVWHGKFAIIRVDDGDMIAIDLNPAHAGNVVYLSHDGSNSHGTVLGSDFHDFLERWSCVGFAGPEDWEWEPFIRSDKLDPDCENANLFRQAIGLT